MNHTEAKNRIEKLRREIQAHAHAYYVLDAPTVSDAVYDSLVREYKSIVAGYPEFADPNFVVERVGGQALEQFVKARHAVRMLSLADVFSKEEVYAWEVRISKLLGRKPSEYFCELKMDGSAVSQVPRDKSCMSGVRSLDSTQARRGCRPGLRTSHRWSSEHVVTFPSEVRISTDSL
jgi:NAD-dependent DNA ligase